MYYIGEATDRHQLALKFHNLMSLGGYKFRTNYKVLAHSDGDLILHTIANAILGSIQGGDIGDFFDDKERKNKNLDSKIICDFVLGILKEKKCQIVNVDLTIICENIFFKEHKKNIAESIKKIINCEKVNVKATRFEIPSSMIQCNCTLLVKD